MRLGALFTLAAFAAAPAFAADPKPDFIERGIVRLLDGLYLDVAGPTTPILICPC